MDECWRFVIDHCRLEMKLEPPHFFEMRAGVARHQGQLRTAALEVTDL